jgi:two-component system, LytTR family, response regulator
MKAVIVEDEKLVAEQLSRLILNLEPGFEIVTVLNSVKSAIKWFQENSRPDLIFMDIQLSDGISFDIFEKVNIECPVIFTTAYHEYALRAFKVNSIDYLVKPIDKEELKKALGKFKRNHQPPEALDLKEIIRSISQPGSAKTYKNRFLVQFRNSYIPIESSQIAYIYRDQIIYLITFKNEKYILDYDSLEEVEDLVDPDTFFRANRQNIVHLNAVENFKTDYSGKLSVKLISPFNLVVDISREKAKAFKQWLER